MNQQAPEWGAMVGNIRLAKTVIFAIRQESFFESSYLMRPVNRFYLSLAILFMKSKINVRLFYLFLMLPLGLLTSCNDTKSQSIQLFNGHDLEGWVIENGGTFQVVNGMLHINRGTGWLRSVETFSDFNCVFEVRFLEENANSGIFVRTMATSNDDEKGYPSNGYQFQCMDTIEGDAPITSLINYGAPEATGETNRERLKEAMNPTGEWNVIEITCIGESVVVKLNGHVTTTATGVKNAPGHIGIQGELGLLEFRKIELTSFSK